MSTKQPILKPFLKWAGGKRWLTSKAKDLLPSVDTINNYFEPFLGGGSVYFHLQPSTAILSDVNGDLINAYSVIREDWAGLYELLKQYHKLHSEEFYYKLRSSNPQDSLSKAARFIYLNRTCWNGLYRVNKAGNFNVPIGTKTTVIFEGDNFQELSNLLQSAVLDVCDFDITLEKASEGDFVFIDPPYTVKHNLNGFVKYNETIFSWNDQIRLKKSVVRAIDRGVSVLITNANHKSIVELYDGLGNLNYLHRASVIAGSSQARGTFSELAIKSW